ncbi:MAG: sulfite exporter TauE/SafE family protein [Alphaproteobacteria bacterium]|nr:sulfite exporter TauE/SafE family protein [Alphaproteobacteria bacterium]
MHIYLPIAEQSVNILSLILMGGVVGLLSGIFGVGGGFLITPMLLFFGISPAVAVGSQAAQILGSSVSGVFGHLKRRNVDIKMGAVLVASGVFGSLFGVVLFAILSGFGYIDFIVRVSYVLLLGSVGFLMFRESMRAYLINSGKLKIKRKRVKKKRSFGANFPIKMRFRQSGIYVSVFLPIFLGFNIGILSAILGVGGGFVMVPAMIYILGMPTRLAIGTSLFQVIFVTGNATFWQAGLNHNVDILLAILLLLGSAVGAQFGVRIGAKVDGTKLRLILALMVFAVAFVLFVGLFISPDDIYSIRLSSQ